MILLTLQTTIQLIHLITLAFKIKLSMITLLHLQNFITMRFQLITHLLVGIHQLDHSTEKSLLNMIHKVDQLIIII